MQTGVHLILREQQRIANLVLIGPSPYLSCQFCASDAEDPGPTGLNDERASEGWLVHTGREQVWGASTLVVCLTAERVCSGQSTYYIIFRLQIKHEMDKVLAILLAIHPRLSISGRGTTFCTGN